MEREAVYIRFWWRKLRERDHFKDPGVDEKIILKWIFEKWEWENGLDRSSSG
jgi:hypothetical protein